MTEKTLSEVENYLYTLLHGTVSQHVFVTSPPETIQASWTDMVVIDLGVPIMDRGAFKSGSALIWLYAKPLSDGRKNVPVMNTLETSLNTVLSTQNDDVIRISRRDYYTDYDSTRNWHVNIVELIINIY